MDPAVRTELTQAVRQGDAIARFARPDLSLLMLAPGIRTNSVGPPPAFDVSYLQDMRAALQRAPEIAAHAAGERAAADDAASPLQKRDAAALGQDSATGRGGAIGRGGATGSIGAGSDSADQAHDPGAGDTAPPRGAPAFQVIPQAPLDKFL